MFGYRMRIRINLTQGSVVVAETAVNGHVYADAESARALTTLNSQLRPADEFDYATPSCRGDVGAVRLTLGVPDGSQHLNKEVVFDRYRVAIGSW